MGKSKVFLLFFCLVLFSGVSSAQQSPTRVIANSENWQDVYSTMHYANLKGVGADFLVSTRHGPVLLSGINKNNFIRVVSSSRSPFVINYPSMIRAAEFQGADEVVVRNANLELIEDLPNVNKFVVVGNTYGYDAIAAAPYASITGSWVFLADRTTIDEIDAVLSERNVDELLIYGFVDREVRETLQKYNPEIIDEGDRFKNNVEIVKKYREIKPVKQVSLTNGEFIEQALMSGAEPILFTGKENVPEQIASYLKSSDIEVGVLVGADLVGTATNIRRTTGISVIVKFARGARNPTGAVAGVENLDLFYIPYPSMVLDLHSAKYNRATSQLELTYRSDSNIPVFFRGTVTPITQSGDGTRIGDVEPIFIAPNDYKTMVYSDVDIADITAVDVFTLYGDTPTSLEKVLEKRIDVEMVNVIDGCNIRINKVAYNKQKDSFVLYVENIGNVDCWVDAELENVLVDRSRMTFGSDGSVKVGEGKNEKIFIEQEMSDGDLESNPYVDAVAYYGEREDGLVKTLKGRFDLNVVLMSYATIGLFALGLVAIVAMVILVVIWKRRRDDDDFY